MTKQNPFRYFKTSPEIIRLAVMMYVRFPFRFAMLKNYFMNETSISAMKQSAIGGTGSVHCSQVKSVRNGSIDLKIIPTGDGILMRSL